MARKLAKSTLSRLRRKLDQEHDRLTAIIDEFDRQRELGRLAETPSEHNADGGSLAFEMEMDLSIEQNAKDLLEKIEHALVRMQNGKYGICEVSGKPIPVARLEALSYATTRVEYADQR